MILIFWIFQADSPGGGGDISADVGEDVGADNGARDDQSIGAVDGATNGKNHCAIVGRAVQKSVYRGAMAAQK